MPNNLLTIDMITREAVTLWRNTNLFIKHISSQYDDSFGVDGAKIGDSLRIRLPNDYTVRVGEVAQPQDTNETVTTLVFADMRGVDVNFSTRQRTLDIDDYSERVLAPMVNNLAGDVAAVIMSGAQTGISNYVQRTESGNLASPSSETWLDGGAVLDELSAPKMDRKVIMSPRTQARTVSSLSGLFNPTAAISEQYRSGSMGFALGFEWYMDQTVIAHMGGTFSAGTVSGANQTGQTISLNAITGTLLPGDIISFTGVEAANRITKRSTGSLAQFVVLNTVQNGGTSVTVYPAIIPPDQAGNQVQYQTVMSSPANAAPIIMANPANARHRRNFVFAPEAVTMVTADLFMPGAGVIEAARQQFDGISMRMITDYIIGTDRTITRLDVLFGYLWVRPEWACVVADVAA